MTFNDIFDGADYITILLYDNTIKLYNKTYYGTSDINTAVQYINNISEIPCPFQIISTIYKDEHNCTSEIDTIYNITFTKNNDFIINEGYAEPMVFDDYNKQLMSMARIYNNI